MATVVNARDTMLQATSPRIEPVTLPPNVEVPPAQVPGLEDYYSSAKQLELRATSQLFQIPKVGAISPASITLFAVLKNITGPITWEVVSGDVDYTTSTDAFTVYAGGLNSNTATIRATVTFQSVTYTDEMTIAKLSEGSDAVVGLLSNESATVAASSDGAVQADALSTAGGLFSVFDGLTNKTGTDDVTYSVVSQNGVVVTIASTGVYTVTALTEPTGTATLRAVYKGVAIDKVYTIAKAIAGVAGTDGADGANGQRGTVNVARAISGSAWQDSEAATAISSNGYGEPQIRDIVTLYNTTSNFSESRFYDGANWLTLDAYVNGNMLVTGTVTTTKLAADAVTAEKINVTDLSSISANIGSITAGTMKSVNVMGGAYSGYAWPASGDGFYLGPEGLLLGRYNSGKYLQVTAGGDMYTPSFQVVNGVMTVHQANVIDTLNIAGEAVVAPRGASSDATYTPVFDGRTWYPILTPPSITVALGNRGVSVVVGVIGQTVTISGENTSTTYTTKFRITRNGVSLREVVATAATIVMLDEPPVLADGSPTTYTYTVEMEYTGVPAAGPLSCGPRGIVVQLVKK